jgi:MFS family permease
MTFLHLAGTRKVELSGTAAIAAVAGMIGLMFAGSTLLTPLYLIYKQQFGFSQITLTLIYAAYVVGNVSALLLLGRLSDEIGRRRAALPALAIAAVSTLIYLFAENITLLFVARILSGLGIGVAAGTGTAWLAELVGKDKARATIIATSANFAGIATGPLVAGLLAQYAPAPLHLPFIVYLLATLALVLPIWRVPETVSHTVASLKDTSWRPRLGVPRAIRRQFVAPAVTVFGAMALVGFFAALAPGILAQELHQTSHAAAGAIIFELGIVVAAIIPATQSVPSRTAMLTGLALMIPSVALIVAAQTFASMPLMIVATAVCGASAGLGYRGSLQVVNQIAPAERRAEVVSSYFVCGFSGNALPVIGVGVIATYADAITASMTFAAMIAIFAVVAFGFGVKYTRN